MRFIMVLLGLSLLSGCMPPSQNQLRMEMDLEQMKRRLAQLEVQKADSSQSTLAGSENQQLQVAESLAGLDNLRVEFQSVNGRIDDLSQDNRALADELSLIKDDLGLQLNALENRLAELEKPGSSQGTAAAPVAAKKPETAPELTAEQLYQEAIDLIRNKKEYVPGRKMLESFSQKYPDHDLYVNSLYWIGEAFYGEKQYEKSILQLQDVISKFASHSKAPAAMLKQALAFNALGDGENARTTMQKLIEVYPDSAQAEAAKK
ncbi:MAG: tol-pal system protein YbgF, partial [Desulfuromonadales bacterium]|nr:tol-pal system protein YbgF [Desulfuromonadales bacterium]